MMRKIGFRALLILAFAIIAVGQASAFSTDKYASQSVLSSGKWVKIKVSDDDIYRITRSDITSWGFSASDFDNIRVYGYGGAPIPDMFTEENYIDDLPQIPVWRTSDQILFFGKGISSYSYQSVTHPILEQQHPYATGAYYFITANASVEEAKITESTITQLPHDLTDSFTQSLHYEKELTSPGQTGTLLVGDDFRYTKSRTFSFMLEGLVPETQVSVLTRFMTKLVDATGSLKFSYNGTQLSQQSSANIYAVTDVEHEHCMQNSVTYNITPTSEKLDWGVEFSSTITPHLAALDFISVNYTRELEIGNTPVIFTGNSLGYKLKCSADISNVVIADITRPEAPSLMSVQPVEARNVAFAAMYGGSRRYVAFTIGSGTAFGKPQFAGNIENQNIHGEDVPNIVIITPHEYIPQAKRIAQLHEQYDSLTTLVLTEDVIFNEFSSGTPDLNASRRMLKMFFDRSSAEKKLGYVILFARGTYDNRALTAAVSKQNYPRVLTWQTSNGLNENSSYCSDDIYGMLSDGAGQNIIRDRADISVGRFPVTSLAEAKTCVDKLESYMSNKQRGPWKNKILIIADDEDNAEHMEQADSVIRRASAFPASNGFLFNRLYTDAFPAISNGTKRTYPEARKRMFEHFAEGVLWATYIGHANPQGWTHDGLLTTQDINNKFYYRNLPFLYTATCEFTRWDADNVSGGELLFLNPSGGTVGMISTTRLALISENGVISKYIASQMFRKDSDGNFQRVGDILRNAKNMYSSSNENRLKYSLIGDPALRLAYPTQTIKISEINGMSSTGSKRIVLKAGETVTLGGQIYNPDGSPDTLFTGSVIPRLYDAETSVETFGHGAKGKQHVYYEHTNLLYLGCDSVVNGKFNLKFRMPSDISNNYSPALLNIYASADNGMEANGSTNALYVYGYADTDSADINPPVIETFGLNAYDSRDGVTTVNENPLVLASFYDDNGINLSTAAIGHQMTLLLDDVTLYDDVVYQYTPESGKNGGTIAYRLNDLKKGTHTLRLKVWDVANNSSESTITFEVQPGLAPELVDVYTNANPASDEAKFYIKHNLPDANVTVGVEVFDLMGRQVWASTATGRSDYFTSAPLVWNLTDHAGRRVPRGIYVYRALVTVDGGAVSKSKSKKIAVTAQ